MAGGSSRASESSRAARVKSGTGRSANHLCSASPRMFSSHSSWDAVAGEGLLREPKARAKGRKTPQPILEPNS